MNINRQDIQDIELFYEEKTDTLYAYYLFWDQPPQTWRKIGNYVAKRYYGRIPDTAIEYDPFLEQK